MRKSIVKAALIIIAITSAGNTAGIGRGGPRPIPPVILSVAVDLTDHLMVISGRHFGSSTPTVILAHRVLQVKTSFESRVVVGLPEDIQPGTYRLTVTAGGPYRLTSEVFSAALFAVAAR